MFMLYFSDIVTISNIEFQDLKSDPEKNLNKSSMIISNPKSLAGNAEIQINANYENALQIVKANVIFLFIRIVNCCLNQ